MQRVPKASTAGVHIVGNIIGLTARPWSTVCAEDISAPPLEAIISVDNYWHGVRPVSYTHLDVYKRQGIETTPNNPANNVSNYVDAGRDPDRRFDLTVDGHHQCR